MRKLYKLKKWYSLIDAAKRLSLTLNEPIEIQDLRQLMADDHLAAYWNVSGIYAIEVAPVTHFYREDDDLFALSKAMGNVPDGCTMFIVPGFERQSSYIQRLDGLFRIDTENIGAAKHWLNSIAAGRESDYLSLEGSMLVGEDDRLWQVVEQFDKDTENGPKHKPWNNPNNFYPSYILPEEDEIVISKAELEKFEAQFLEPQEDESPLFTTERNTLLTVLAAICDYSAIKHQERGTAAQIAKLTQEIGAPVTDDTIRKILKQIPDALESRMK